MSEFTVYAEGIVYMSVCSSLSMKDTIKRLNATMPTGTSERWVLADEDFRTGETNPCPCEDFPTTHKHYLCEVRRLNEVLRTIAKAEPVETKRETPSC